MEVIRHPDHGKAVVAIMVIMAAQQLTGTHTQANTFARNPTNPIPNPYT